MRGCGLWSCVLFVGAIAIVGVSQQYQTQKEKKQIDPTIVKQWAAKFGTEMWESLGKATQRNILAKDFESHPNLQITKVDGFKMVTEMAENIQIMMQHKIDAIKRIKEHAENFALDHKYDRSRGKRLRLGTYHYTNSKKLNVLPDGEQEGKNIKEDFPKYMAAYPDDKRDEYHQIGYSRLYLTANKHFSGIPVNMSRSSVHVPTNVNDEDPKVINAIDWSRKLEDTFIDNYKRDPSLSWQYFGSSTGFMRQYPTMKWHLDKTGTDMYDARMRDWYIKSSASPKNIVILWDTSGSMTGLRKEIAKDVVLNILKTLSEDDFVTVLKISKETTPLVDCFVNNQGKPELMQATNENLSEIVDAVKKVETTDIANITSALEQAFIILNDYRRQKDKGAYCNEAIMLITDSVPHKEEIVFIEYNQPHKPTRLFPYIIGGGSSNLDQAKWMACENKGYFTQVTTLAEVKEQVLKYLRVMARPMVLNRKYLPNPIRWTGVYADASDPNTNKLIISVSIPVYDKKNFTTNTLNNYKSRVAELLGVAGTDIPIEEIKKLTPAYKLGVNGYSFVVNNNGFILYHPDLRPKFKEILKPNYNSVDLTEVELVDEDNSGTPRNNNSDLYQMRKHMVNQEDGQSFFKVKVHFDEMKRATTREQNYFFHKISSKKKGYDINNTPFSLGIVFPHKYGKYRVSGGIKINNARQNASSPTTQSPTQLWGLNVSVEKQLQVPPAILLEGTKWKLHPNWVYCEYNYEGENHRQFDTPEKNMMHFMDKISNANGSFNWGKSIVKPLTKCKNNYDNYCTESDRLPIAVEFSYYCDSELVEMLVLDAQITEVFTKMNSQQEVKQMFDQFGINLSFVATRSGLTRWVDPPEKDNQKNEEKTRFTEINNKATDEVWYKRAVDYHYINPESFVFSVPFDVGDQRPTVVTATHAIFKGMDQKQAAAAVVGVLLDYDKFKKKFLDSTVSMPGQDGEVSCESESFKCYVVDNNGFVVISEEAIETGKFFGKIESAIFHSLVQNHIFKEIQIFDYQAVCLEMVKTVLPSVESSPANALLTPFKLLIWLLNYVFGQIAWLAIRFEITSLWNPDWTYAWTSPGPALDMNIDYSYDARINKTKPKPCDKETYLYELNETKITRPGARPIQGVLRNCHESGCEKQFMVTMISHTNLILVVTDAECPCYPSGRTSVEPTKVDYVMATQPYGIPMEYCKKLKDNLYRKTPHVCFNYHVYEEEIRDCGAEEGSSSSPAMSKKLFISLLLAVTIYHVL